MLFAAYNTELANNSIKLCKKLEKIFLKSANFIFKKGFR